MILLQLVRGLHFENHPCTLTQKKGEGFLVILHPGLKPYTEKADGLPAQWLVGLLPRETSEPATPLPAI